MTVLPFSSPTDHHAHSPQPKTHHLHRRHAPQQAPCPTCGQLGTRKQFLARTIRSLAYQAIVFLHLTTAEYRASCDCCRTFRTQIEGVEPKAKYDNQVREAILDRLLADRMSLSQIQIALRRDFHLDLSTGFLYDCLHWKIGQLDGQAYRQWTVAHFSGTMCLDELHLGDHTLLLATDPLHDFPIAFALVSANDQEHMGRFLRSLRDHGFEPKVVVTDGSPLYPELLATLWPQTQHQLCVFHVLKDINAKVLEGVRRVRNAMKRRGRRGRKRPPGRPKRNSKVGRQQLKLKDKAAFVFKNRFLVVRRREHLDVHEQKRLLQLLEYAPSLRVLREFMDEVECLFVGAQTPETAWRRREALVSNTAYQAVPELAAVLKMVPAEKFAKMIAFLAQPVAKRVRTNNHVERMNRVLRLYEKSRYKWRRARTKVRFVWLLIERGWGERVRRWRGGVGGDGPEGNAGALYASGGAGEPRRDEKPQAA